MKIYKLIIEYENPNLPRDEIYFKIKETARYYKNYYKQDNSIKSLKLIRINVKNYDTKPIQK